MKDHKKERIITIFRDVYSNFGMDINKLITGKGVIKEKTFLFLLLTDVYIYSCPTYPT